MVKNSDAEAKIEVVKRYFRSLAEGDMTKLSSLIAEDIIWNQPGQGSLSGVYRGKESVFGLFGNLMRISEGSFKITDVSSIMTNGAFVSATLKFSARKSDLQKIEMSGVDVMRIENGQIKEVFLFSQDQGAEDAFWG